MLPAAQQRANRCSTSHLVETMAVRYGPEESKHFFAPTLGNFVLFADYSIKAHAEKRDPCFFLILGTQGSDCWAWKRSSLIFSVPLKTSPVRAGDEYRFSLIFFFASAEHFMPYVINHVFSFSSYSLFHFFFSFSSSRFYFSLAKLKLNFPRISPFSSLQETFIPLAKFKLTLLPYKWIHCVQFQTVLLWNNLFMCIAEMQV